ncbi:LysR family transcriptional regulator [Delftia sp. PS-11]|uniref:LysR family transcriptional regulator n=1 Tax=Delftia sp. PS-11 TaxID=2767222 RepID=UPI00245801C3|nr:LysR family transcriptional regulator [Delftia sp. PS-11]KAJ8743616.1 LysR family transcriptional regulator [Delftia sp. PS-11]
MPPSPAVSASASGAGGADANRFAELEMLVQVAERGSLSAAARSLGLSPSAVSKTMSRLEARLGVQLLQRSTRRLQLTPEGMQLYERGKRVLADLDELEACVAVRSAPRGLVRISTSSSTGKVLLLPLVPKLLALHPGLRLEIDLTDQIVDLVEAGIDIAIRWGQLPPSDMVARLLGHTRQVVLASPAYLQRMGRPLHPDALSGHVRLGWNYPRAIPHWPFLVDGRRVAVDIGNVVRVNDGDAMRELALAGTGLARLSLYHAWEDIQAARLVPVLEDYNTGDLEPIHAVYLGRPDRLPPRTRAVLDFLQAHVDLRHAERLLPP